MSPRLTIANERNRMNYRSVVLGISIIVVSLIGIGWIIRWCGSSIYRLNQQTLGVIGWPERTPSETENNLRQQLSTVTKQLQKTQKEVEARKSLEQLENIVTENNYQTTYARIIAYNPDPGIKTVSINRGSRDGIQIGQAAINRQGFIVGIVQQVRSTTATILIIIDPQSKIVAKVKNETESRGIVSGAQGLTIQINYVPKNDPIEPGLLVVTTGSDPMIPVDIPIGTTGAAEPSSGDLFQTVILETPADFRSLDIVGIIRTVQ